MKRRLQRAKVLRDHMLGLRMELDLIINDLNSIDTNLEYLAKIESDLSYNVKVLKKEKVIVVASQYRRAVLELESVKKNKSHYLNTKLRLEEQYNNKNKLYNRVCDEYDVVRKKMESSKVILLFDQSKRRRNK